MTNIITLDDLIIRPFDRDIDFDRLIQMEKDCFESYEAWSKEQYEEILDNPNLYFMVAYDQTILAGNAFAFVNQGDDKDTTHLDNNVVGSAYRRKGLGRFFTNLRLEAGRVAGDRQAIVEVAEDNDASIKLLLSVGFSQYGRFPGYYKGKKDAILMHRRL